MQGVDGFIHHLQWEHLQAVRRLAPPTEVAAQLRGMVRHRYELTGESTQRKNKLTAICDELFPELTRLLHDPNSPTALALRQKFPTPAALSATSLAELRVTKGYTQRLTDAKLLELQRLAAQSIGTKDTARRRGLVFEQEQLMQELALIEQHLEQLEVEMIRVVEGSREGKILTSIPPLGPIQAATIIAMVGNIANFERPAQLKSYFGWAPALAQSGSSLDRVRLSPRGTRLMKQTLYLIVWQAIRRKDCEWARIYERLVPIKCSYDKRTHRHTGRGKVIGRIAGQIASVIYALLKKDQEMLATLPPDATPPEPVLYDPEVHRKHRDGYYRAPGLQERHNRLVLIPPAEPIVSNIP